MTDLSGRLRAATGYYDGSYPPELITPPTNPPTLTSLNPTSIVVDTPTLVTVTGTNFYSGSRIFASGTQQITHYISPTQLSYEALADQAPGHSTVEVHNGTQISNSIDLQVTVPPAVFEITGCTPNTGPAAGGTSVTITGNLFTSQGAVGTITGIGFGSAANGWFAAANQDLVNDTTITCDTPGMSTGVQDIRFNGQTDEAIGVGLFTAT